MLSLTILLLASAPITATEIQVVRPVRSGIPEAQCNLARVSGVKTRLNVRAGPGGRFRRIGAIHEGQRVFTCNERGE